MFTNAKNVENKIHKNTCFIATYGSIPYSWLRDDGVGTRMLMIHNGNVEPRTIASDLNPLTDQLEYWYSHYHLVWFSSFRTSIQPLANNWAHISMSVAHSKWLSDRHECGTVRQWVYNIMTVRSAICAALVFTLQFCLIFIISYTMINTAFTK